MAYKLNEVTIRTNNSAEGMAKIGEIWGDITSGRLPLLFDSENNFQMGISPVSRYSNYESDHNGEYDLSILGVTADFFRQLETEAGKGTYKKYDVSAAGEGMALCGEKAWEQVWDEQSKGVIKRLFTVDYESTVPAQYAKDGKMHCYLYIAVQP